MIYIKNTTTKQEIWIPRNEVDINVIPTPKTYEEGYKEGQKDGKEEGIDFQKDQLLNLYVTENGVYEREDGYGKVTVVINEGGTDCKEAIEEAYEDGYKEGYEEGAASTQIDLENKSIDIVSNGEYTVTPTDGFDALESVKISVDVPNEGKCNLEDKIIAPQTNEVDDYGYIYIRPNEGYDGLMEVALQTSNLKNDWYNEGYEEGMSQGGECNIQADKLLEPQLSEIEEGYLYVYPDEGYIGMSRTVIQTANLREGWYKEGYEQGKEEGGDCNLSHQLEVIETNGRHIFYPQNNGWDGYDFFEVEVDVPTTAKLQDVWVTPSMADRDGNNLLVYSPNTDEGYDGLSRVVIDPQTIYNEGYNSGKTDGYNSGYSEGKTDGYNEGKNVVSTFTRTAIEFEGSGSVDIINADYLEDSEFRTTNNYVLINSTDASYLLTKRSANEGVSRIRGKVFDNLQYVRSLNFTAVMEISDNAFENGGFTSVYFDQVLGEIGDSAFKNCSYLKTITYYGNLSVIIADNAFENVNGVTVYLREGVDETPWLKGHTDWNIVRL